MDELPENPEPLFWKKGEEETEEPEPASPLPQSFLALQELETELPVWSLLPGEGEVQLLYGHKMEGEPLFCLQKTDGREILAQTELPLYVDELSWDQDFVYLSSWKYRQEGGSSLVATLLSAEDLSLLGSWEVESPNDQARKVFAKMEKGCFVEHCGEENRLYRVDERGVTQLGSFPGKYCYSSLAPSLDKMLVFDAIPDWEAGRARTEPWPARVLDFSGETLFELEIRPQWGYQWSRKGDCLALYSSIDNLSSTQRILDGSSGQQLYPKGKDRRYRLEALPVTLGEGVVYSYLYFPETGDRFY